MQFIDRIRAIFSLKKVTSRRRPSERAKKDEEEDQTEELIALDIIWKIDPGWRIRRVSRSRNEDPPLRTIFSR